MSSSTTYLHRWCQLPWLHTFLYLIFSTLFYVMTSVSCSATQLSYSDHCAKIVPESTPTSLEFTTSSFPRYQSGYYHGGDRILNPNSPQNSSNFLKSLWFRPRIVYKTEVEGVFKVEGSVKIRNQNMYYFADQNYTYVKSNYPGMVPRMSRIGSLTFGLQGFWSESLGKLCMVGSGSFYSKEGNLLALGAVLKLNYFKNSSIVTSLVSGTLESLSSTNDLNYFEPISILMFAQMNYNYTLVSEEFGNGCSAGSDIPKSLPLSSQRHNSLCSILSRPVNGFELKYASDWDSAKNCTPFGGSIGYLPRAMSLNTIQCSEDDRRFRVLVEFPNSSYDVFYPPRPFNPNTTLVGEGLWDGKKNQLCVVACRILNMTDSLANAHVGDCSVRLTLRFPAIWSIRDRSRIVGQIWSNKTVNDSGYFNRIMYRSYDSDMVGISGLKYEYTQSDRLRKSCPVKKLVKNKGARYPNGNSYDLRFDISGKNSKGIYAWGYLDPLSVGDQFYEGYMYSMPVSISSPPESFVVPENSTNGGPLNISYKISYTLQPALKLGGGISPFNISSSLYIREEISAEGVYDVETGGLCMVGCRNLDSNNRKSRNDSMDCEILVNFQFPPSNSKKNGGFIKGRIESTREKSDPLYFERLDLSSTAFVTYQAKQSIWRMDLEITMVLISNTLACIFVGLQLFYVTKHPDMLPFTSIIMLGILTFGYMIPLVLNFEALFLQNRNRQNVLLGSGGWLEVNEVIVRVVTMVAFLLQFRLLQLTWSTRFGDGSKKDLWAAEKKALFVCLPLYVAGGLIACSVNWSKNSNGAVVMLSSRSISNYQQHSLWGDLKSYGGLVLDGFLLPQILLNLFWNLRDKKPLSCSFYIGTTFVRLLPHAYDLYRAHSYVRHFVGSYIYANPGADFYSTTWDVIIPFGGLLFATIIYLQQRFGGHCILPRRLRQLEAYEKVPVVSNE